MKARAVILCIYINNGVITDHHRCIVTLTFVTEDDNTIR